MIIRKKRKKKKRTRISPWLLIAIFVLAAGIGALLYALLHNGRAETTEFGSMVFSLSQKSAVIIRDEHTYVSSELAKIDFLKEEGETVLAGESLATVYKLGYSDELMRSLLNLRESVYNAQMERIGSTKDSRLDEFNDSIYAVKKRIESCVMNSSGEDLEQLYRELDELLKDRMEYLRSKVQETEALRQLYADVQTQEELISAWTEETVADRDGLVSYYFDGYEQAMNVEKLNMVTADLINRAVKESGTARWTTDDKTRVCRVVNKNRWYIAFVTKGDALKRVAEGVEYEVTIDGYGTYTGTALEPVVSGSEVVNLIEFNTDIGRLMEVRSIKIDVKAGISGIRVKSKAITFEEHEPYLELILTNSHHAIRIDVLAVEDNYAIIRAHDPSESLNEGVSYWNRKR